MATPRTHTRTTDNAAADQDEHRPSEGRQRVVIEGVEPEIDCGRFAVKRVVGELIQVEADCFTDGHDLVSCVAQYRHVDDPEWDELPMAPLGNDRWRAEFRPQRLGRYRYRVQAWVDHFKTWAYDMQKRVNAAQDVAVDLQIGAQMVEAAQQRAEGEDAAHLGTLAALLRSGGERAVHAALSPELAELMWRNGERAFVATYRREPEIWVDRPKARYSTWYEFFPRSTAEEPGRHGTFKDAEARLPYVAAMGFDVLYLPPIHPIGRAHRKGRNNQVVAQPGDVGSPWAIGGPEGGHKAVHPQLGTVEDFEHFVKRARDFGVEVAMDLALQASPDHPYVREHPEWFKHRPDGTIQYAENPPKKYQDIYPFDFETPAWRELWDEIKSIVLFWIGRGVTIFRVDNPHTKPFPFWEWLIAEVRHEHPEVIFLSEAFTRPKVMYRLAKLGFTQSYTYFAWRNTSWELREYVTELTQTKVREFFRPNFWTNTQDILTEYLQLGGRPAFTIRVTLAATLAASYGIFGPSFELMEATPREPGSEEYLDSEKYEVRHWNWDDPNSLRDYITRLNRIRRDNPALQRDDTLRFHPVDNDRILCFSKQTPDRTNQIVVVVNTDPYHTQGGWIDLPYDHLGLDPQQPFQVHNLLSDARYIWHGGRNYVELNPHSAPARIFRIRRRVRSEHDFEYFL